MTSEQKEYRRQYRLKNKDRIDEKIREWRLKNPELVRAYGKRTWEKDKDKHRAATRKSNAKHREAISAKAKIYREENREKISAKNRSGYARTKERKLALGAQWRADNKERMRDLVKAWEKANPERLRQHRVMGAHRRRALVRGCATDESFTRENIESLRARAGRKCAICRLSKPRLTIDHIFALAAGGSNILSNIQFLCKPCNSAKGMRDPIEFAQTKGLLL